MLIYGKENGGCIHVNGQICYVKIKPYVPCYSVNILLWKWGCFDGIKGGYYPIFYLFYAHSERPPAILAQLADVFKFPKLMHRCKRQRPLSILSLLLSMSKLVPYTKNLLIHYISSIMDNGYPIH